MNRELFRDQGVCYPGLGEDVAAHHVIADWARHTNKFKKEIAALKQEIADYPVTILSSEALCDLREPAALKTMFPDHEISIILYLRDPVRYLVSWWQQDIQMGDEFLNLSFYLTQKRRSYLELINTWEDVFGRDALNLRLYSRHALPKGNVLDDFLGTTDLADIEDQKRLNWENNPSISGNLLFFKLLYNSFRLPYARSNDMIMGLTEASKKKMDFRVVPAVPEPLAQTTRGLYEQELEIIQKTYGLEIPVSPFIAGVSVPDRKCLKADFELLCDNFDVEDFPLLKLREVMTFVK
ncbi:MAG: hypothetical protein CMK09_06430 [Ponticaulis sp.]|nr:hypothetical protein [Ponticaulis sp.]